MKKELLKPLDYFSYKGMWSDYIKYLKKEISDLYATNNN